MGLAPSSPWEVLRKRAIARCCIPDFRASGGASSRRPRLLGACVWDCGSFPDCRRRMPRRSRGPGSEESFARLTIFPGELGWGHGCCGVWRLPTPSRRSSATRVTHRGKSWARAIPEKTCRCSPPWFSGAAEHEVTAADACAEMGPLRRNHPTGGLPAADGIACRGRGRLPDDGALSAGPPAAFQREKLYGLGVVAGRTPGNARDRSSVRVAGLVLVRQRPATASGITFVTLEDETESPTSSCGPTYGG